MAELRSITTEKELMERGKKLWVVLGKFLEDNEPCKVQLAKSVSYADMYTVV